MGRQCQFQACGRATNIYPPAGRCLHRLSTKWVLLRIKLPTADLAALNRAILETPTGRGDDAPCSAQMRPPWGPRRELCLPGQGTASVTNPTLLLLLSLRLRVRPLLEVQGPCP